MMSLNKFLTFFFFPHFRLWTQALFMDQITLLFLQKQDKNYCLQFRRLGTWSVLIMQREVMLLRLVPSLTQYLSLSNISLQFFFFRFSNYNIEQSHRISLSHFLFLLQSLSLGCVACVCVLMVVWPWVWVLLFLWVCDADWLRKNKIF